MLKVEYETMLQKWYNGFVIEYFHEDNWLRWKSAKTQPPYYTDCNYRVNPNGKKYNTIKRT